MYCHEKAFYVALLIFSIIAIGCATTYAPDNWLPDTDEVSQSAFGGWMTLIVNMSISEKDEKILQYGGEFIADDSLKVYLLYDSLYVIPKEKIENSVIEIDDKNTGAYAAWVVGGSLLTLSNGYYAAITFPLWMVGGIPAVSGESLRDRYEADFPNENYWDEVRIFARFPQGVDGINLTEIKPIMHLDKK